MLVENKTGKKFSRTDKVLIQNNSLVLLHDMVFKFFLFPV